MDTSDTRSWQEIAEYWFNLHTELSNTFDPKLADYYADNAYLQSTSVNENGEQNHRVMPALMYRNAVRNLMGLAKSSKDKYSISDIEYSLKGKRAVIIYNRYSHLKGYKSPVKVVIGLWGDEAGLIFEEYSISMPYKKSNKY